MKYADEYLGSYHRNAKFISEVSPVPKPAK